MKEQHGKNSDLQKRPAKLITAVLLIYLTVIAIVMTIGFGITYPVRSTGIILGVDISANKIIVDLGSELEVNRPNIPVQFLLVNKGDSLDITKFVIGNVRLTGNNYKISLKESFPLKNIGNIRSAHIIMINRKNIAKIITGSF